MTITRSTILLAVIIGGILSAEDSPKRLSQEAATSAASSKVQPEYPQIAKQLGLEGKVELVAVVDEAGAVQKVETVSGNPILARAAVDALKRWKFKPHIEDGKAIKVTFPVAFTFKR
jgi:periplasmic protein TonB